MTLRTKLVFALMLAALLPMLVAVAVSVLRAESRAQDQAARRLDAARRQASTLVERFRKDTDSRVEQAASDFANDPAAFDSLLGASRPSAREVARRLAEVHGLDHLEILDPAGIVLSTSRGEGRDAPDAVPGVGARSALADVQDGESVVREIPVRPEGSGARLAVVARRPAARAGEILTVAGARFLDEGFLTEIAEVSGEAAFLIDPKGAAVLKAYPRAEEGSAIETNGPPETPWSSKGGSIRGRLTGDTNTETNGPSDTTRSSKAPDRASSPSPTDLISGDIPVGGSGWHVRVAASEGDVKETRRELLAIFAGIAPFALASALVIGVVLAEGFSRPIRALAARAEEISAENREPFSLPSERNEVRRLTVSFDRMLEALSDSARQRVAAERIAAWQDVARRIAHEVKNPLSPIKMAVENLRRTRVKAPADLDRALDVETATILEEVESLRRLVDEFSQFARMPRPQPVPCDPREIVSQALALFHPRFEAARIQVECDFDAGAPPSVIADPEQIGRVMKNVLANAVDALASVEDRRLFITLRAALVQDPFVGRSNAGSVSFAEIEVRDSGIGFDPALEGRIFEPYFTTRADSGGTGLGMAIAYRIVADHGGTIRARGTPGRGATITIRLPVTFFEGDAACRPS